MNSFKCGKVTGTGAAINVELGFIPDFVQVINYTDGDQIDIWQTGMTAATSVQINTAVSSRGTNGISAYAGDDTHKPGFTIGSGVSENGKNLYYQAWRNIEGA
jgi:hypothetical protein